MDSDTLLKWLIAPGGLLAGAAAWLFRRRLSGSWIGRRLAAERALGTCQQDLIDLEASFARQESTLLREIAGRDREVASRDREIAVRDREVDYLMRALERLTSSATEVIEVHDAGLLRTSANSPSAPSPSPAPSPTSPEKPPPSTVP